MRVPSFMWWCIISILASSGCSLPQVIPKPLASLVDRTVTFQDVLAAPEPYTGRVVVWGGEVLKATRLKEGTQLEFLQLPLDAHDRPILDRLRSEGRFLVIQQEFLDPATIVAGTKMTVVGEVSGGKIEHLDDIEYRYPILLVKHLHAWPMPSYGQVPVRPRFSFGVGGGTGIGVGGGGGIGIGF